PVVSEYIAFYIHRAYFQGNVLLKMCIHIYCRSRLCLSLSNSLSFLTHSPLSWTLSLLFSLSLSLLLSLSLFSVSFALSDSRISNSNSSSFIGMTVHVQCCQSIVSSAV